MICSRCRTEIQGGVCSNCGLEEDAEKVTQRSIPFESRTGDEGESSPHHRLGAEPLSESSRPRVRHRPSRVATGPGPSLSNPRISRSPREAERRLFPDEFLSKEGRGGKRIVTVGAAATSDQSLVDKPLIRMPAGSRPLEAPRQQDLRLEAPPPQPGSADAAAVSATSSELPAEIILSRLLSGIVDASLSVLTGFLFSYTACLILNRDFLLPASVALGGVCSLGFYVLSSSFFLISCGQTPGMYLTELRLVADEVSERVSTGTILLRVVLFLPVAASFFGLCLSLFDRGRRCLHDRLTHTRIVPMDF